MTKRRKRGREGTEGQKEGKKKGREGGWVGSQEDKGFYERDREKPRA